MKRRWNMRISKEVDVAPMYVAIAKMTMRMSSQCGPDILVWPDRNVWPTRRGGINSIAAIVRKIDIAPGNRKRSGCRSPVFEISPYSRLRGGANNQSCHVAE